MKNFLTGMLALTAGLLLLLTIPIWGPLYFIWRVGYAINNPNFDYRTKLDDWDL